MLESKIESWLDGQIKKIGGKSYKFVSPGNPGVPDRIFILPGGKVFFVELKRKIGRLSNVQIWQREQFKERGIEIKVIYGMDQAKEFVKDVVQHEVHST